jgi:hypothetical protein
MTHYQSLIAAELGITDIQLLQEIEDAIRICFSGTLDNLSSVQIRKFARQAFGPDMFVNMRVRSKT